MIIEIVKTFDENQELFYTIINIPTKGDLDIDFFECATKIGEIEAIKSIFEKAEQYILAGIEVNIVDNFSNYKIKAAINLEELRQLKKKYTQ